MNKDYKIFEDIQICYNSLIDDLSKKLFKARLDLDIYGSIDGLANLCDYCVMGSGDKLLCDFSWLDEFKNNQKPVFIYGAMMTGEAFCKILEANNINVLGFFDRNYELIKSVCDLPVLPPPFISNDNLPEEFYILISACGSKTQIYNLLLENNFPKERILPDLNITSNISNQYFDFMDKYKKGVFIDAGCFNCYTSIRFAEVCKGNYTKIFAFEPDKRCFDKCKSIAKETDIKNFELINAGLWNGKTQAIFFSEEYNGGSRITQNGDCVVELVALDDIIKNEYVSFIKMDIEGAELNALIGASNIIKRDKPLCAISVYHKAGDIAVITSYLKNLVPEYRFAVRHYTTTPHETVLYAFV